MTMSPLSGDVVHVKVFSQHLIYLNSWETCYDLFEKRSTLYSDRFDQPMIADLCATPSLSSHVPLTRPSRAQDGLALALRVHELWPLVAAAPQGVSPEVPPHGSACLPPRADAADASLPQTRDRGP